MTATETPRPLQASDLPVHLTHFVGRERELDDVARLLPSTRMVSLTGVGGMGKTRLAREVATRVASSYERVAWIDFAPVSDEALIPEQAVAALRLPERLGASPLELLLTEIGDGAWLVVFDNCEHLVDGCAALADALLRACPRLGILATTREALGVPSETSWLVPPLASDESVQLFAERAQGALASFRPTAANVETIREICRRLDGLPLAVELAAARVRALSLEQIAERLNDMFRLLGAGSRTAIPRHRTLRAVIDWSYSLLTRSEQVLLGRLAVFAGSFALEAIEDVCAGNPLRDDDLLDGVAALVEKSLVVMDAGDRLARYRLLETVRQYGMERLAAEGDVETRRARHAEYFAALAERVNPQLIGGEHEVGLLARVRADDDNLRAACAWSLQEPERASVALRLGGALFWYWYCVGHFHEAKDFLDAALARRHDGAPLHRARALLSRGLVALTQGGYAQSTALLAEASREARACGDNAAAGVALAKLGASHLMLGETERAAQLLDEAVNFTHDLPPIVAIFSRFWRGWAMLVGGESEEAEAMFASSVRRGIAMRHPATTAHSLSLLGHVALAQGKVDVAATRLADSLSRHLESGDAWGLGLDYDGLAAVSVMRGDYVGAVGLLAGVDMLRERTGTTLPAIARAPRENLERTLRDGSGADYEQRYAEGKRRTPDEVARLATAVAGGAGAQVSALPPATRVGESIGTGAAAAATSRDARPTTDERTPSTGEHRRPQGLKIARVRQPTPVVGTMIAPPAASPMLRVNALGPLEVTVRDRPIRASDWGSARPRELLLYLLMHPGCTKEQVGAAFWPEATTAQVRNNFHVTLHRLRKALGDSELVVMSRDRYRVDPDLLARFDATTFVAEVAAARAELTRGRSGAVQMMERAIAIYRGDFMDGEPAGDWHLPHRDELQRTYTGALLALGTALSTEQRHAKAAEAFQRVLARDELHEEALRALMKSHALQGERTAARNAYERFARRLRKELHAAPSRETMAVLEQLDRGPAV